jgi:broad specificity phosphatase PhoE
LSLVAVDLDRLPDGGARCNREVPARTHRLVQGLVAAARGAQRVERVNAYWDAYDPTVINGPGAESFEGLLHRVGRVLRALRDLRQEQIVVVSHANFMRALLFMVLRSDEYLEDLDAGTMRRFRQFLFSMRFPNTAILPLRYDRETHRSGWLAGSISDGHLPEKKRSE